MHLVWVYPDKSPAAAVHTETVRIVLPSGEFGYVAADALLPLPGDLLCYVKDGNAWQHRRLLRRTAAGQVAQNFRAAIDAINWRGAHDRALRSIAVFRQLRRAHVSSRPLLRFPSQNQPLTFGAFRRFC